jgi:hypothetical protein
MTSQTQMKPARAAKTFPTDCPNWGKGGSYTRDPDTGQRKLDGDDSAKEPTSPVKLPASAAQPVAGKAASTEKGN